MQSNDAQVRRLMEEYQKRGKIGQAAMMAGMDRKTASKYIRSGKLPSQTVDGPREWRTREDPFVKDWPAVEEMLNQAPELEAKMLFEYLIKQHPGRYEPGQVRTFQRRIKRWRAMSGPPKEVFFGQLHRPGEAMQTDFTDAATLGVTIDGKALGHLLCHNVLPYSNWEWATVCYSESLMAIKHGSQEAVFQLGRVPEWHQTDNSSAATHQLAGSSKRGFNFEYEEWVRRLGMKPRTTAVGKKEQNGDVESHNGKRNRPTKRVGQGRSVRTSSLSPHARIARTDLPCPTRLVGRLRCG